MYLYVDQTELSDSVTGYKEVERITKVLSQQKPYDQEICLFRNFAEECTNAK